MPLRFTILHLGHMGFTDALTFMVILLIAVYNPTSRQIIRRYLNRHLIPGKDANVMHPHLAGNMGQENMLVFQFYLEHCIGKGFNYLSLHFNLVVFSQTISCVVDE